MKGSSPKGLELSTLSVFFNISLLIAFLILFVILTVWISRRLIGGKNRVPTKVSEPQN